jgi:hypothetical protein
VADHGRFSFKMSFIFSPIQLITRLVAGKWMTQGFRPAAFLAALPAPHFANKLSK